MTMRTARFKKMRNELHQQRRALSRKPRQRVDAAIHSCWTLKEPSEEARERESERSCLRAKIVMITVRKKNSTSPDDPEHKQIDTLTRKLHR